MKMKETLQWKNSFSMRGNLPNREAEWQKTGKKKAYMNNVKN